MLQILPLPGDGPPREAARPGRRPLYGVAVSRAIEQRAAATLPPHTLMQRAGMAVARLARAWQTHARRVGVIAGAGNNGGDGWYAAALLHRHLADVPGAAVCVWAPGGVQRLPADARWAYEAAVAAGVRTVDTPPDDAELLVDAVFGLGLARPVEGVWRDTLRWLHAQATPTLCVDLPSGLDADTGRWWVDAPVAPRGDRLTLSLLTLKPGLFTGMGRAAAGEAIWFDDLGVPADDAPTAWLQTTAAWPDGAALRRAHASHKGSRGDVLVIGGQSPGAGAGVGMGGAALLAGRAALRAGAGRVYVGLLAEARDLPPCDPVQPALMLRTAAAALGSELPQRAVVVAGCGGGDAIHAHLTDLLARCPRLVLDADALNALGPIAAPSASCPDVWRERHTRGWWTVLTPHPLEAARLLGTDVAQVQADRPGAARTLAKRLNATVVLKGSGSVTAAPGVTPIINGGGDGALATAGTGDVLAGLIGARLAALDATSPADTAAAVADAVAAHGDLVRHWTSPWPPTATDLIA